MLYKMCMEMLDQKVSVTREWIDSGTAQIQLTDQSYVMVETQSKSDYSDITEVLFYAISENDNNMAMARYSMFSTIYAFDYELGVDKVLDLVMNILPDKGEYTSSFCHYKFVMVYNVMMLTISPK